MPEIKCKKCGASLHPEQKMCMACGAPTDLMPGIAAEEKSILQTLPWKKIAYIGIPALVVILIIVLILSLRETPPDKVTKQWLDAVTSRRFDAAKKFTTEEFEKMGYDQPMSERKSDEYYLFIYNNEADYTVSPPQYNSPQQPTEAVVTITFTGKNGQTLVEQIRLVHEENGWKISSCQ
jgi:hypothetical protein